MDVFSCSSNLCQMTLVENKMLERRPSILQNSTKFPFISLLKTIIFHGSSHYLYFEFFDLSKHVSEKTIYSFFITFILHILLPTFIVSVQGSNCDYTLIIFNFGSPLVFIINIRNIKLRTYTRFISCIIKVILRQRMYRIKIF